MRQDVDLPALERPGRRLDLLEEGKVGVDRRDPVPRSVVKAGLLPPAAGREPEVPAEDLHAAIVDALCAMLPVTGALTGKERLGVAPQRTGELEEACLAVRRQTILKPLLGVLLAIEVDRPSHGLERDLACSWPVPVVKDRPELIQQSAPRCGIPLGSQL
jgi:hypothetical protein